MRYTESDWTTARQMWSDGYAPLLVEQATGIKRSRLYKKLPKRGQPRISAFDLRRMKTDWDNGMPVREMVGKYGRCRSRFYQLAQHHGWDPRHRDTRETPVKVETPLWRRCCGQKLPYVSRCPQCEEPV